MILQFESWEIGRDRSVAIEIATSPAGPIRLLSWATPRGSIADVKIPMGGSAIVLPTAPTNVAWNGVDESGERDRAGEQPGDMRKEAFDTASIPLVPLLPDEGGEEGGGVRAHLGVGCYALVPGGATLWGGAGLIIQTPEYAGLPQLGGPVETGGRLKYIDGCSDSLLICPAIVGDPCLNLLHLPPGTEQTQHTHPSARIGIILRGAGVCKTPDGEWQLRPGMFWFIPPEWQHSFHTGADSLDVLAWHPDSDFGPSHDWHPMLNRTIVDGAPAHDARNVAIRTTSLEITE
jgi:mannose-6-phosphate isomerase-like protein (cupin superfamily)